LADFRTKSWPHSAANDLDWPWTTRSHP
jgi:hypothetical protein